MIPQVRGFQGCYLDNHRNNWRCARAVPALCENAPFEWVVVVGTVRTPCSNTRVPFRRRGGGGALEPPKQKQRDGGPLPKGPSWTRGRNSCESGDAPPLLFGGGFVPPQAVVQAFWDPFLGGRPAGLYIGRTRMNGTPPEFDSFTTPAPPPQLYRMCAGVPVCLRR